MKCQYVLKATAIRTVIALLFFFLFFLDSHNVSYHAFHRSHIVARHNSVHRTQQSRRSSVEKLSSSCSRTVNNTVQLPYIAGQRDESDRIVNAGAPDRPVNCVRTFVPAAPRICTLNRSAPSLCSLET